MFYLECYDQYGNPITRMTQWDLNQKIYITEHNFTTAPLFHYCNKNTEKALVVQSTLSDDNTLVVDIPNQLLIEPYPITVYVYLSENETGKTVEVINIPITARPKPNDFEYKDNIEIVNLTNLADEIRSLNDSVSSAEFERITAETLRISNENERIESESTRKDAEQNRIENENIRVASENERESSEDNRVIAESVRIEKENVRNQSETKRNEAESERKLNEETRQSNELKRIEEEELRRTSEDDRRSSELERNTNEELRKASELNRNDAELIRVSNEEIRKEQENIRQTNTFAAIENAEKATDRANIAAKSCEDIITGTGFITTAEKGVANGIATLDENGKVNQSQIPPIDAKTLCGKDENYFASSDSLSNHIENIINSESGTHGLRFYNEKLQYNKDDEWNDVIPKSNISTVEGLQDELDNKADKSHEHSSYINQNAFSNIQVDSTTITANSTTDSLTFVAGSNILITPNISNNTITIESTTEGGSYIGATAPSDTKLLWIDTSNGGILKYYDDTDLVWKTTVAVWG